MKKINFIIKFLFTTKVLISDDGKFGEIVIYVLSTLTIIFCWFIADFFV